MDFETIQLEIANGVARLTLNRPDRLNSFTVQMHDEVSRALEAVSKSDARVLVLTGAGRGFCAGQDLSDRAVAPGGDGVDLREGVRGPVHEALGAVRDEVFAGHGSGWVVRG